MSKKKAYKKKKESKFNILIALAILSVVLVVAAIAVTALENSKYDGLLADYTKHEYGERQKVKLQKSLTAGIEAYANENYAYYVEDNFIYDNAKNIAENEAFAKKAGEAASVIGTVNQQSLATYTDGSDFSLEYDYIIVDAKSAELLGSKEAAADKMMAFIEALGEDYNVCGLYFNIADDEYYYTATADIMTKETVTKEMLLETMVETEAPKVEATPSDDAPADSEEGTLDGGADIGVEGETEE